MVGSKHTKSKTAATTQSATGQSQHDNTTSNQLLYSGVEAVTPHPAILAAITAPPHFAAPLFGPLVENATPSYYMTPSRGLQPEPTCSSTDS
ncbi:hypothetical protein L3X38_032259 [Prunus dulcis]|uniref:Uncharacterized protein n=1 Tax=Prunus dulcis TaxID=3755 RepID=A0AAD4VFE5_PRUDU|nr:hypothetical protein L3X38_032259 [Prunus dulcis]